MRWINLKTKTDMPKINLTEWKIDKNDVFNQRVLLMQVLIEHTKLGLKLSKDAADNLLAGKSATIEANDSESVGGFLKKLGDLGVSAKIAE